MAEKPKNSKRLLQMVPKNPAPAQETEEESRLATIEFLEKLLERLRTKDSDIGDQILVVYLTKEYVPTMWSRGMTTLEQMGLLQATVMDVRYSHGKS